MQIPFLCKGLVSLQLKKLQELSAIGSSLNIWSDVAIRGVLILLSYWYGGINSEIAKHISTCGVSSENICNVLETKINNNYVRKDDISQHFKNVTFFQEKSKRKKNKQIQNNVIPAILEKLGDPPNTGNVSKNKVYKMLSDIHTEIGRYNSKKKN